MYIPAYFRNDKQQDLLAFMRAHPFALVASNGEKIPNATHLPFAIREKENGVFLLSHFSAANPHAKMLREGEELLIIFSGPNAYVSPSLYEKKENVPTWNYIAVHATAKVRLGPADSLKEEVLSAMISRFEPGYRDQWNSLDPKYLSGLMNGIIAFEAEVINLEGKFKLSQNKTENERQRIAQALRDSGLSQWMNETQS
jgi:transcriptional regulator